MIRFFLFATLICSALYSKGDINQRIKSTTTKINSFSEKYSQINEKMAQNAKDILAKKLEIQKKKKLLTSIKEMLITKEVNYKENKLELAKLLKENKSLKAEQQKIEEDLVFVIAQSVSLSVIAEDDYATNTESLIEFEVLKEMLKASKMRAKELNDKYYKTSKTIKQLNKRTKDLKVSIRNIENKRKEVIAIQEQNRKSLKELRLAKESYKEKLQILLNKQDTLKKTLSELNIVKIDEERKEKEERERRIAFENKKAKEAREAEEKASQKETKVVLNETLPKVKKHGSSYKAIKTKNYRGAKTIAPLDSYTVTKKYGTYTDPIYGIKIFNESISLKPDKPNAKVKTVFNGKVIYADKTAVLDNIVIVEHKNGLHTIYANLSQISPNIKKGKKIKKGYAIGRVSDELVFEVTQNSYHINPIRLFK